MRHMPWPGPPPTRPAGPRKNSHMRKQRAWVQVLCLRCNKTCGLRYSVGFDTTPQSSKDKDWYGDRGISKGGLSWNPEMRSTKEILERKRRREPQMFRVNWLLGEWRRERELRHRAEPRDSWMPPEERLQGRDRKRRHQSRGLGCSYGVWQPRPF